MYLLTRPTYIRAPTTAAAEMGSPTPTDVSAAPAEVSISSEVCVMAFDEIRIRSYVSYASESTIIAEFRICA